MDLLLITTPINRLRSRKWQRFKRAHLPHANESFFLWHCFSERWNSLFGSFLLVSFPTYQTFIVHNTSQIASLHSQIWTARLSYWTWPIARPSPIALHFTLFLFFLLFPFAILFVRTIQINPPFLDIWESDRHAKGGKQIAKTTTTERYNDCSFVKSPGKTQKVGYREHVKLTIPCTWPAPIAETTEGEEE